MICHPLRLLAAYQLAAVLVSGAVLRAQDPPPTTALTPGTGVERRLTAGEVHVYAAALAAERRYLVDLEQLGIDVKITATFAGGPPLAVDAPVFRQGRERLLLPERAAGGWRFEVESTSPAVGPGTYRIRLTDVTTAAPERLRAEAAMTAGARFNLETGEMSRGQAIEHYGRAHDHWRALGAEHEEGQTLLALAVLHSRADEPRRALELFGQALERLRRSGDTAGEAVALNDLGLVHSNLGEREEGRDFLEQAIRLQRVLGDGHGEAVARNNLCILSYFEGRLRAAAACYREALELLDGTGELRFEASTLGNLGTAYLNLGEPRLARESYRRALALRETSGDRAGQARTWNDMAVLHRRTGEIQEAVLAYGRALEIFREVGDERREARTLNNLGFAYYSLGEPRRALSLLRRALPLRRRVGDRRGEAVTLRNLGLAESSLGKATAAEAYFRDALDLSQALDDLRGIAAASIALGRARRDRGELSTALSDFETALAAADASGDRAKRAKARHHIGEIRRRFREGEAALASLRGALEERRAIRDRLGEAETLTVLALVEDDLGHPDEALAAAVAALDVLESLRGEIVVPRLRATFSGMRRQAEEVHLELLMRRHAAAPSAGHDRAALETNERARSRTLIELLREAGAGGSLAGVLPELARRRRDLDERRRVKARRQIELLGRGQEAGIAELELHAVLDELDRLDAEIRRHAAASRPSPARPQSIRVDEIRALLRGEGTPKGTVLLEYALGTERSFLWALTPETFASFELPGRAEIENAARDFHQRLRTVDPRGLGEQRAAALAFSHMLLGPVAERLDGQRLVVVADGALHYVPFAALPHPAADAAAQPLVVEHEIVYLPSAAALAAQRRQLAGRAPAPKSVAVLADPVFERGDPRVARAGASAPREDHSSGPPSVERSADGNTPVLAFERLPATRREAERIAELVPASEALTMLGFEADRDAVFSPELGRYRVVHFATHSFFDAQRPELSGLVLSLVDEEGRTTDGFLRLRDVYELELGADLVVLSGCQTALGREIRGEGLVGLTRGFMYAGVPRVMASLWRVEDRVTADLMERFYRELLVEGRRPAAALRRAQLSILAERRWSAPYYWAAFVLQGDWRSTEID